MLLDGTVHTDALCVRWGLSQSQLEIWLKALGGEGDVQYIYI